MNPLAKGIDVSNVPLCDVSLLGISWLNEGKDLALNIEMHSSYKGFPKYLTLLGEWATNVSINLDWGDKHMGTLLSWDFAIQQNGNGTYRAVLDMGGNPGGYVQFTCNQISINS